MIKSMTGYGSAKGVSGKMEISVELKSVNSRYYDCTVKLPRTFTAFEEPMKSTVGENISRGKVDVYVSIDSSKSSDMEIKVNSYLAEAYITSLRALAKEHGLVDNISATDILKFPDVLQAEKSETDPEQLCADIRAVLKDALVGFDEMRAREGAKLYSDLMTRLLEIERLTEEAEQISPKSVANYLSKLESKMREFLQSANIDENRILAEAALFADKVAINEETVRLKSHISQLRDLLESSEPVGRKIDFLVQEFNREANTIGSKGNDTAMARIVVDMKSEIEKIREQAQNIE